MGKLMEEWEVVAEDVPILQDQVKALTAEVKHVRQDMQMLMTLVKEMQLQSEKTHV
jgi:hypothetical protein